MEPIELPGGVFVPVSAMSWRAVRSSGPGGQNVNKVASKVELRIDLARIRALSAPVRERLARLAASRLDSTGRLLVTSQRTRDQARNLEDARFKAAALIARALHPPRARVQSTPTRASEERRLAAKRRDAEIKRARRARPGPDEE